MCVIRVILMGSEVVHLSQGEQTVLLKKAPNSGVGDISRKQDDLCLFLSFSEELDHGAVFGGASSDFHNLRLSRKPVNEVLSQS